MEELRGLAAAQSAAVLGSRNARRQMKSVLTAATQAGAYSVGFSVARGGLTGFSVYLAGDFAGAGQGIKGVARFTRAVPTPSRLAPTAAAQPTARNTSAAAAAPAQPAAARRRGCRAGAKIQLRRHSAGGRLPPTASAAETAHAAPLEGGARVAQPSSETTHARTAAPHAPPLRVITNSSPSGAQPLSSLSPLAPIFAPPSPPSAPAPMSPSQQEKNPPDVPPNLRHLLPHSRFSYEEERWDHYRSYGGPFPAHSSHKKRREPPSPPWPPSSAIVGCVVNERRPRAAPPPPPTPRLPPERER